MKKRIMAVVTAAVMMAAAATGCGSASKDYRKYVKVGQYKGIEVAAIDTAVSDEELTQELANMFHDTVQEGDTVNIDFAGYLNGEAFEGGTATGYNLTIGSGSFIDGFEDGLIGKKIGEEVSLNLTFPEDYENSEELRGKAVVFECKINSISNITDTELTLDYVVNNTSYTNIADYKESVRNDMIAANEEAAKSTQYQECYSKVMENCSLVKEGSYPKDLLEKYEQEAKDYFDLMLQQYAYYYYLYTGTTIANEDLITMLGYTQEDIDQACKDAGKENAMSAMVFHIIAEDEGITVSQAEFEESLAQYISDTGSESAEDFYKTYNYTEDSFREDLLFDKVMDFILDNVVIVG